MEDRNGVPKWVSERFEDIEGDVKDLRIEQRELRKEFEHHMQISGGDTGVKKVWDSLDKLIAAEAQRAGASKMVLRMMGGVGLLLTLLQIAMILLVLAGFRELADR